MATSVGSTLDATYIQMINELMQIEKQPLTRLTQERDDIAVRNAIYSDLSGLLDGLQSATKALISSEPSYAFSPGRAAKVESPSNFKVLTASATNSTAATSYRFYVDHLATSHTVGGAKQSSQTGALGIEGSLWLGASGHLAGLTRVSGTVDDFTSVEKIASGQNELSSGDYFVETINDLGVWKFHLVDSNGNPVSIQNGSGSGTTSEWQSIPTNGGSIDTGRGLAISFGGDSNAYQETQKDNGAAKVTYEEGRTRIDVNTSDSLENIAYMINHTTYPAGNEVIATIVDSQLFLSGKNTGVGNLISASDSSGTVLQSLGILTESGNFVTETAPRDASFTANGIPVLRSSNSNLTDVISGVTLNLVSDAEGQDATLTIMADTGTEKTALNSFIDKFNNLIGYLSGKLATTKQANGTYKRGSLAGDSSLYGLRVELTRILSADVNVGGTLKSLREIGITMDENFKLSISDSAKLEDQLTNNKTNVLKLVDTVMGSIYGKVGRFTGTNGYVTSITKSLERIAKDKDASIARMNERLEYKENSLYQQFINAQSQIEQMSSTLKYMQSLYASLYIK